MARASIRIRAKMATSRGVSKSCSQWAAARQASTVRMKALLVRVAIIRASFVHVACACPRFPP